MNLNKYLTRKGVALAIGIWLLASAAHAVEFRIACRKAKSEVESPICNNPRLGENGPLDQCSQVESLICNNIEIARLHWLMRSRYEEAIGNQPDTPALKAQQAKWLKERDACTTVECIKRAYLNNPFVLQPRPRYGHCVDVWADAKIDCKPYTHKGDMVCEPYLKHLNTLNETPYCDIPVPPGFKSPQWQELDVLQHLDWAYRIEILDRPPADWKPPSFEDWRQDFLEKLQAGKIAPHMKKARIKPLGEDEIDVLAYTGDRLSCQRRLSNKQDGREGFMRGYLYRELTGEVEQPLRTFGNPAKNEILLFSGETYLISSYGSTLNPSFDISSIRDAGSRDRDWRYKTSAICSFKLYAPR